MVGIHDSGNEYRVRVVFSQFRSDVMTLVAFLAILHKGDKGATDIWSAARATAHLN